MAYTEPITNRTMTDIVNRTAKGHFNLSDWERITGNTTHARELVEDIRSVVIREKLLPEQTVMSIPSAALINRMVENIIAVQERAGVASGSQYQLFASYDSTVGTRKPDYETVNAWERVLDLIVKYLEQLQIERFEIVGFARCGADLTQNSRFGG